VLKIPDPEYGAFFMITCILAVCLLQTPSQIPGRIDFVVTDTVKNETLTVTWVAPEMTKNVLGEECWLYDGKENYSCDELDLHKTQG
jgi:hypothetical protein